MGHNPSVDRGRGDKQACVSERHLQEKARLEGRQHRALAICSGGACGMATTRNKRLKGRSGISSNRWRARPICMFNKETMIVDVPRLNMFKHSMRAITVGKKGRVKGDGWCPCCSLGFIVMVQAFRRTRPGRPRRQLAVTRSFTLRSSASFTAVASARRHRRRGCSSAALKCPIASPILGANAMMAVVLGSSRSHMVAAASGKQA
jgi:hypothetical protein